ncbi:MAG TPA: anti-sigma factor [Pseudolabrys sp.]|jgi:anti-sigma-K factor RskA
MSDTNDHSALPDDELLAAEYALGVLAGTDRAAAQRLLERDRNFARMVAEWEQRLAPWAGEIAEVSPPPQVWEAIVAALPAAAAPSAGLWQSLLFWRGFALASALAAACLGAFIYLGAINREQPLVATIEGGGSRAFVATIDAKRGTIAVVPAAFSADATRVPELWLIPADGKPRALGLLRADRTVTITIPPEFAGQTVSNAVLAVSLEPPGGSPTGAPTGPVIGTGKLTSL